MNFKLPMPHGKICMHSLQTRYKSKNICSLLIVIFWHLHTYLHNIQDLSILSSNTEFVHLKDAAKYGSSFQMCYTLAILTIASTLTAKDSRLWQRPQISFCFLMPQHLFWDLSWNYWFFRQQHTRNAVRLKHVTCNSVSSLNYMALNETISG
jgi:hypothetical protein